MANRTEWQAALDRCVGAYYDGDLGAGLAACETVLAAADVPDATREQVLRNEIFYAPPLRDLVSTFVHRPIDLPLPAGWFPLNPSIARDGDGFLAIVRAVNYELAGPGRWIIHDPDGISTTENYLVRFDGELRLTSVRPIADETPTGPRCPCPYAGLEDCRLIRWRDRWVASCGVVDRHPSCMGHIAVADLDVDAGAFRDLRILSEIDSPRWEKNWMPFTDGDDLLFVYRIGPTEILRYDPDRQATTPVARHWSPPLAAVQKGGSQGVRVGDGWLFSVHQSADFREGNRCYLHRWARLDASYRLTHLSDPFVLLDGGVEFCSGLALDGDRLVASFGSGDRAAHLLALSLADVVALLRPVERPTNGVATRPANDAVGDGLATAFSASLADARVAPGASTRLVVPRHASLLAATHQPEPPDADWLLAPSADVGPMWTHAGDREVGGWIRDRGTWGEGESLLFRELVRPGMHVVDIGANIGYFTLLFVQLVGPRGRVLAIEAEPTNARLLAANVALNGAANVEVVPVAVDRAPGVVHLSLPDPGNLGGYSAVHGGPTAVQSWAVDDLLDPNVPIHVVKIDIEGMDHRAVQGMGRTLRRWAPTVLVEFHPVNIEAGGDDPEAVLAAYAAAGMEVSILGWDLPRMAVVCGADLADLARRNGHTAGDEAAVVRCARSLGTLNLVLRPLPGGFTPVD